MTNKFLLTVNLNCGTILDEYKKKHFRLLLILLVDLVRDAVAFSPGRDPMIVHVN
jgi:hypothetical protein